MTLRPRLLDRMLIAEVLKTLAVILLVLLILLFATHLMRWLGRVASGQISADVLMLLVGLELLKLLGMLVPPAFFFSVLWVLGRMYRDSEVTALASAGVGLGRLYRAFAWVAIPLALVVAWLVMSVLPWAKSHSVEVKQQQKAIAGLSLIRPGRFHEFRDGDLVIFAEGVGADGVKLKDVFIATKTEGILLAQEAYLKVNAETGQRYVVLASGKRYSGQAGRQDWALGEFAEYAIRLPSTPIAKQSLPLSARSWRDLLASDQARDLAEFHYRLSFPLAILAFTLISVPLARSLPRQGVYGRLGMAVVVYFIFLNLQQAAEKWLEKEILPIWLGLWWLPLLMLLITLAMVFLDSMWFANWRRLRRHSKVQEQ